MRVSSCVLVGLLFLFATSNVMAIVDPQPGQLYSIPPHTVSTKANWADAWAPRPGLFCTACRHGTGITISEARFAYEYGDQKRPDDLTFGVEPPLSLGQHYVKVEFDQNTGVAPGTWYGIIVLDENERWASSPQAGGNQAFTAFGFEWALTRERVVASIVASGSIELIIDRGLPFNGGNGDRRQGLGKLTGNRNAAVGPTGAPIFAEELESGQKWNAAQCIEYLLSFFTPYNIVGGPTLRLESVSANDFLSWYVPDYVPTHNRTVYDIINQLVNRQLAATWSLEVREAQNEILLRIHSLLRNPLTLPGGVTIGANPEQIKVNFDTQIDVDPVVTQLDTQRQYQRVIVTGARRGAVFTVGPRDNTLVEGWIPGGVLEVIYNNPSAFIPDFFQLSREEQLRSMDVYRGKEESIESVYAQWRVPSNWDGWAAGGDGLWQLSPVCPELDAAGAIIADQSIPFWRTGLRFRRLLPLLTGIDYRNPEVLPDLRDSTNFRPMFAVYELVDPVTDERTFAYTHDVARSSFAETLGDNGLQWSSVASPLNDALGVSVSPSAPAHVHALNHFPYDENDLNSQTTELKPVIDYDGLMVTVFCEFDERVVETYPPNPAAAHDRLDTLTVAMGDRARLDYICPSTVVGVEREQLHNSSGGFVRDDRMVLRDVARLTWEWYQTPRQSLRLRYRHITTNFFVGQLITDIFDAGVEVPINTVISSISWNFLEGSTAIETQFIDVDFAAIGGQLL